jgi:uncharacterized membrane protein YecN with MAPEG domain
MHVVPLYAALLAVFFSSLSLRTIRLRRSLGIAVGDSGNETLLRAMRVHSNFAEYVPLALILLYFVEARGVPTAGVHALCLFLVLGRVLHAHGVSRQIEDYRFRVSGMALTFTVLLLSALILLLSSVRTL